METMDIFPTLCDLTGVEIPDFIHGVSLVPQLENPHAQGHPAVAYWGKAKTIRNARYRLVVHNDGTTELYDHATPEGEAETLNVAQQHPEIVEELKNILNQRLSLKTGK